jgi:hypothetical protein
MVDRVGFVQASRQPHTFKFKATSLQLRALICTFITLNMFNRTICVPNRNMHFSRTQTRKENVFYCSRDHPIVPAICSIAKTSLEGAMATAVGELLTQVKRIDELCAPSHESAGKYQSLLKELYDVTNATCRRQIGPLPKLTLVSMDDESVWEQLQTRNAPLLRLVEKMLKRLKAKVSEMKPPQMEEESDRSVEGNDDLSEAENSAPSGEDSVSGEDEESGEGSDSDGDFDETKDDYENMSDEGSQVEAAENDAGDDSNVDEDDRMEAWLDREDELEIERQYRAEKRGARDEVSFQC